LSPTGDAELADALGRDDGVAAGKKPMQAGQNFPNKVGSFQSSTFYPDSGTTTHSNSSANSALNSSSNIYMEFPYAQPGGNIGSFSAPLVSLNWTGGWGTAPNPEVTTTYLEPVILCWGPITIITFCDAIRHQYLFPAAM